VTAPDATSTSAMPGFGLSRPVFSPSANGTFTAIATNRASFEMTGDAPSGTRTALPAASAWTTASPSPRSGCRP
jgi:hypothetical protein